MSSSFIYAREAIETVSQLRFRQFNNYRWSDVKPSDLPTSGPGFDQQTWQAVASEIIRQFNINLKPHPSVRITSQQKDSCFSKRLVEFQLLISAKADEKIAKTIVSLY